MLYDLSCPCRNCTLARQEMAEAGVLRVMGVLSDAGFVVQEAPNSTTGGQDFTPCGTNAYRDMKPGETCRDNYGRVFMRTDYDKTGHDFRELTQHEYEAMESAGGQDFVAPPPDPISHPEHYARHPSGVECITIVEHFGFNLGNVIKYIWRAPWKGATLQDLKKARWYLDREVALWEERLK